MTEGKDAFRIPASFINERVVLDGKEVVWGFKNDWLSAHGAVLVCVHAWSTSGAVDPLVERIGSLLSDEEWLVPEIVDPVQVSVEWTSFEARVWLFLAVSFVYEKWEYLDDPHEWLESIFADFEYPAVMNPFIRYMPYGGPGEPPPDYVDSQLAEFVEKESERYRNRKRAQD